MRILGIIMAAIGFSMTLFVVLMGGIFSVATLIYALLGVVGIILVLKSRKKEENKSQ